MSFLKGTFARVRALLRPSAAEREVAEEIRFHLDMEIEKHVREGLSPAHARRKALLSFGGEDKYREAHRDVRGLPWVSDVVRDARYALRVLRRNPVFAGAAVLTLGVALGAGTLVFTMVNGLVLRPFQTHEPERLVALWGVDARDGGATNLAFEDYLEWRDRSGMFAGLAARVDAPIGLARPDARGGPADLVWAELVTDNYFDVLDVRPLAGRLFATGEGGRAGSEAVVVLGENYWRTRLGGDPSVVGDRMLLNGEPFTVIAIAPESFRGVRRFGFWPEAWVPIGSPGTEYLMRGRGRGSLIVVGRLAAGVTSARADAAAAAFAQGLADTYPETNRGLGAMLTSARTPFDSPRYVPPRVLTLASVLSMGAVALILLIACANLANLLLARASARSREIAIRLSIGGGRGRIVRQLLAESAVLAAIGGAIALLIAMGSSRLQTSLLPQLPFRVGFFVGIDVRVVLFTAVVAFVATFLFGLAPALQATRLDLVSVLKSGAAGLRGSSRRVHARDVLVVGQIAVSVVLLIAVALFLRSLAEVREVKLGLDPEHRVVISANPALGNRDPARVPAFYEEVHRRVEALPGVVSAAWAFPAPFDTHGRGLEVYVDGVVGTSGRNGVVVSFSAVESGLFETLGTRLLAGRDIGLQDSAGAPLVVVVNRTLAQRFWPEREAVGQQMHIGGPGGRPLHVVGVVDDVVFASPRQPTGPYMFLPWRQHETYGLTLIVHTREPADRVIPAIRDIMRAVDPAVPSYGAITMRRAVRNILNPEEGGAAVASVLGAVALLLAVIGLYGVVAYTVERRTREMGIRIALGATPGGVLRQILTHAVRRAALGILIGLVGALAAGQAMASLLFGVRPLDPLTYVTVPAFLLTVTLLASYIPARRAARVDPLLALRSD